MSSVAYEIRTAGEVPRPLLEDFDGVTVLSGPGGSTIHVVLRDEAELHGLLEALSRGGFVLIDLRREHEPDLTEDWTSGGPPPAQSSRPD